VIQSLKNLSRKIDARYIGKDTAITGVHIDSKKIRPNELFVAIVGTRDGHQYIPDAINHGASAVLVSKLQENLSVPQILVPETQQALFDLALAHRKTLSMPVIAITGSCGKTTTKEMLAHILSTVGKLSYSQKSFNNHLGVPITLLSTGMDDEFLLLEAGTNSPGEIARLATLIQPNIAGITNIGASHLEKLLSLEGVMSEKGNLLNALPRQGTAIINIDDPYIIEYAKDLNCQKVSFSIHSDKNATITLVDFKEMALGYRYTVQVAKQLHQGTLTVYGAHNLQNVVMAISLCYALDIDVTTAIKALENFNAYQGRSMIHQINQNLSIIDDSYNASVQSVESAIAALSNFNGVKILVLSSMGELGKLADFYHHKIGQQIDQANLDTVYLYGNQNLADCIIQGSNGAAEYCNSKQVIINNIKNALDKSTPTRVVVKGARAHKMEEISQNLICFYTNA